MVDVKFASRLFGKEDGPLNAFSLCNIRAGFNVGQWVVSPGLSEICLKRIHDGVILCMAPDSKSCLSYELKCLEDASVIRNGYAAHRSLMKILNTLIPA